MVTVVEELAILAYNDESGRNSVQHIKFVLAGGVLLELVVQGRLNIDASGRVTVVDPAMTGHSVVDAGLQRISGERSRKAKTWVKKLARDIKPNVLQSLVDQRILTHERTSIMGLIPFNRYRPVDGLIKVELRSRLAAAAAAESAPDVRTAALAGGVYAGSMHKLALPEYGRFAARKALKTVYKGSTNSEGARQAIEAIRKAINEANAAAASSSGGGS